MSDRDTYYGLPRVGLSVDDVLDAINDDTARPADEPDGEPTGDDAAGDAADGSGQ
ncbi:MAG: hypothetical protein WDZ26_06045 [Nitriliruptoraceae bacterium]